MIYKKTKAMLENALEDVANKGELTSSNLDIIEKLICSIKNINDIEDMERSSYENRSFDSRPSRGYTNGYDYDYDQGGRSYARRRNSMGRYTNDHESELNEIIAEMHELKNRVSDPSTKHRIEDMIKELRM